MISKLIFTVFSTSSLIIIAVNGRSANKFQELKPVLIKSVVSHPALPPNHLESLPNHEESRTSRKIYQFPRPGQHHQHHQESEEQPSSPQKDILHRPKSGRKGQNHHDSSSYQNEMMPNDNVPVVLNGKGKKVKYVPTSGHQGPGKAPQVYVISGGDEDEDAGNSGNAGMMGSMQTYFKSMTGRIRAAFQGLIGGITD